LIVTNRTDLNINTISDFSKNNNNNPSLKAGNTKPLNISDETSKQNLTNNKNIQLNFNESVSSTYFSTENFTLVTTQVGSIIEIPCSVHHIGEGMVSFFRKELLSAEFMDYIIKTNKFCTSYPKI
jgi:ABC-type antimicrobial peptide transport system permease subunit